MSSITTYYPKPDPLEVSTPKAVSAVLSCLRLGYDYLIQPVLSSQTAGAAQAALIGTEVISDLALSYQAYKAAKPKTAWEKGTFIATSLGMIPLNAMVRKIPIVGQVWDLARLGFVARESVRGFQRSYDHFAENRWQAAKHFAAHALSLTGAVYQTRHTLAKLSQWVRDLSILPGAAANPISAERTCEEILDIEKCIPLKQSQKALSQRVRTALQNGGRIESSKGGEVYRIVDDEGNIIALFKTWDKHFQKHGMVNVNKTPASDEMIYAFQLSSFEQGRPHLRQQLIHEFDGDCVAEIPPALITSLTSDQFVDSECPTVECPRRPIQKRGYLQAFIPGARSATDRHPELFVNGGLPMESAYNFTGIHELDRIPLKQFQRVAILDILLYNEDRNTNNLLFRERGDGSLQMIPIDHDSLLPYRLQKIRSFFNHAKAAEPLCAESLDFLQKLDPELVYQKTLEMGLVEQAAINAKSLAIVLKKFAAAGKSLRDIYEFVSLDKEPTAFDDSSPLWTLMKKTREEAIQSLNPDDAHDYKRHEYLRWLENHRKGEGISASDRDWLDGFRAGDRRRIESFIQNTFWSKLQTAIQNLFQNH